jgi:hypothetical protein
MIACVSPAYEESRYCRREIKFADLLGKPILPVAHRPYRWGPGLAFLFQERQILLLTDESGSEHLGASAKRLLQTASANGQH